MKKKKKTTAEKHFNFIAAALTVGLTGWLMGNFIIPNLKDLQYNISPRNFLAAVSPGTNEAVFYFTPENGTYETAQEFSVNIRIGSSEGVTSVKSYINFDSSVLSVLSIDTSASDFSYWWENSYNNTTGRIQLQASAPAPGFAGDGSIAVITFRTDSPETASIAHNSGSLALKPNDENILNLSRSTGASFTISAPDITPPSTGGHNPPNGATGVTTNTNIVLQISDSGDGIDIATVVMTVEGSPVPPTVTGSPASYTLTYNPANNFDYNQTVNVAIDARDLAEPANIMTTYVYSFTTESAPLAPPSDDGDTGGTSGTGGSGDDTTAPPADINSPIISDIAAGGITNHSATVSWKTNEPSTSQVNYGPTEDYRFFSQVDNILATAHSLKIEDLKPGTKYYFKVISKDAANNQTTTIGGNFTTASIAGDLNKDGKVNIFDLSVIFSNWKKSIVEYDLNGDEIIDIFDLSVLLSNWTK